VKTLCINTYAGSLLLGANAVKGAQIIGSFEDCGFGAKITKANRAVFTEATDDFQFVDHIKDWPSLDLTDTVILAHPPCAAFSQQNTSKLKRGTNTDAFECTRKVLQYAMSNNAAAIAVESVPGALRGAWDTHQEFADRGGYHLYRVLKNSILFGVPQFRERFWAVFVREGSNPEMTWRLQPRLVTVASTVDALLPGSPVDGTQRTIDKFVSHLCNEACRCGVVHGFDEQEVRRVGFATAEGIRRVGLARNLTPRFFPGEDHKRVLRQHISPFTSGQPSNLAPGGFVPVLLGSSLWVYKGTVLCAEGYKAVMGFPPDYIFPEDRGHGVRTFLSKGVCPPVATWILENLREHLGETSNRIFARPNGYSLVCAPNKIVSFKPSKNAVLYELQQMLEVGCPESDELLELRDEEER
jgi:site-specific DNA-cytosine methylase